MDGYSSCDACYESKGPEQRDCGICLFPEYQTLAARDGRAPYFAVLRSFVLTGRLIDSASGKAAAHKRVMLGFPNGICFQARSDEDGRFAIHVDSTQSGKPGRINLGTLRHHKKTKTFIIGFALERKDRHRRKTKTRRGGSGSRPK